MNQNEAIVYSILGISGSIALTLISLILRKYCKESHCSGYGLDIDVSNISPKKEAQNIENKENV